MGRAGKKVGGLELEAIYLLMAVKIIQSPNQTISGGGWSCDGRAVLGIVVYQYHLSLVGLSSSDYLLCPSRI